MISWAVEALCRALAPGLANDTLPTRTLCTTVLEDFKNVISGACLPVENGKMDGSGEEACLHEK